MSSIDFTSFLKLMAHQKASDLFITAGMPPSIKVHGKISPVTQNPLTPQQARDLVLNVMTPAQREEFEKTHECNFAIGVSGVGRFRVSCFYQRNQVGMVLRRIETKIPTVEELNLPPIIKTLAMTKRGIIIFVGATGTGKSTSLAAMIGYRNQNSTGHIITIEDPIEWLRGVGLTEHAINPGTLTLPENTSELIAQSVQAASNQLQPMMAAARNHAHERIDYWIDRADRWQHAKDDSQQVLRVARPEKLIHEEKSLITSLEPDRELIRPLVLVLPDSADTAQEQ